MRAYQNMVFSTAVRLVGSESDAEDISQEVFLRAYEHYEELSQSPTAGGWLKTVARNLALNHLTRYRARWRLFSEVEHEDQDDGFAAAIPAPDLHTAALEAADRRQVLEAALEKLPTCQRVPLVLYHFENLSYEEIAARLKVSLGKIKTDIHRARETLRRRLAHNPVATAC
jgi:RNA polymerase sigma-70 factor (ECF subfamily)